ncbi:hypothetical protein AAF712_005166 [Marasmius tenuissimus]|uniref:DUF6532 domain-containing protein n=1 Tax=Marasmius tenuissimus TaxID=585030 RepID=A0ABR3A313_9AGAR
MSRPLYNFTADAQAPQNYGVGQRRKVPSEKARLMGQASVEEQAKKAQKAAAAAKRKKTTAGRPQLTTRPREPFNNAEPSANGWPGGVTAHVPPQPPSTPTPTLGSPQPEPLMLTNSNWSDEQLAQLGLFFAQNHYTAVNNTPSQAGEWLPGNFESDQSWVDFDAAEIRELEDDPEGDNEEPSEEARLARSIVHDEQYLPSMMGNGGGSPSTPIGNGGNVAQQAAQFAFQFPQLPALDAPALRPPSLQMGANSPQSGTATPVAKRCTKTPVVDDGSDDEQATPKVQKRRGFNALGLSTFRKQVNSLACKYMNAQLAANNAWPDQPVQHAEMAVPSTTEVHDPRQTLAAECWYQAHAHLKTRFKVANAVDDFEPSQDEIKLISSRDTQLRNIFKKAAQQAVPLHYDLMQTARRGLPRQDAILHNRGRVAYLKAENRFLFENPDDVEVPLSIYKNEIFEQIIVKSIFNNSKKSIGLVSSSIFGDVMPIATLALATTAVEAAIDEYREGFPDDGIPFTTGTYLPVYHYHYSQLLTWQKSGNNQALEELLRGMMTRVKCALGVLQPTGDATEQVAQPERAPISISKFT